MSLSLEKLHRILFEKGLLPGVHFHHHDNIKFIEVFSANKAETFLLTIPSRYDFKTSSRVDSFSLKQVPMDSFGRVPEKYAKLPDNIEMSSLYDEIELSQKEITEDEKLEDKLMEGYKKTIPLANSSESNMNSLRDIFNQLKRISHCVSNLKYRVCIFHKIWLVILNNSYDVDCYYLKGYQPKTARKFLVTIDLENFLQLMASVPSDVEQINAGISRIIDKNGQNHISRFVSTVNSTPVVNSLLSRIEEKRATYTRILTEFSSVLETLNSRENDISSNLDSLSSQGGNVYNDMDRVNLKGNIERELDKVRRAKKECLDSIAKIKERERNLVLAIDKILFENLVMLDTINQNIKLLYQLVK